MTIETKFKLGQYIYITGPVKERTTIKCPACKGKGYITLNGKNYSCPEFSCHDGKIFGDSISEYRILHLSKIGKITVEITEEKCSEKYMVYATGVGSGTLWEDGKFDYRLFADRKEAENYCKMKNKEK